MSKGVLLIDIGNTRTTVSVVRRGRIGRMIPLRGGLKSKSAVIELVRGLGGRDKLTGAGVSSVVPGVNEAWRVGIEQTLGVSPVFVDHRSKMDVAIDYPRPASIGADRLANACAALKRYGAPVIVADFGTALTFDVINSRGAYTGGVIAPGLPVMTDYLAENTALLPRIKLEGALQPVGRSTPGAMRIGAKIGYRGMVREIVSYLEQNLKGPVQLVATGGYARWALDSLDLPFRFDAALTLYGIYRIYQLNNGD